MLATEIPEGEARRCAPAGMRPLAIFNVGGEIFVTDDTCTHGLASLSDGFFEGDIIECPLHGGAFNVRTGAATVLPCTSPIRTYAASVEEGFVCIAAAEAEIKRDRT